MKHDARRGAILAAAAPLFARAGLHGTTTRELAAAAGVSEALLLKHFVTKDALYRAVGEEYVAAQPFLPELARLRAMPPSTARLVTAVHYLVDHLAQPQQDELTRLLAHSLLGDGEVARRLLNRFAADALPVLAESLATAKRAGDLRSEDGAGEESALWLVHHLALMVALLRLPPGAAVAGVGSQALVRQVVHFVLNGIGLRTAALREFYPAPVTAKAKPAAKPAKGKHAKAQPAAKSARRGR
jgi:AcrR family transcriptional regulator